MRASTLLLLTAVTAMIACSSKQGTTDPAPSGAPPIGAGGATGSDVNPDGVPYPTRSLGPHARGLTGAGAPNPTPGNVIPNLKFYGYPSGDSSKPLQPVSLADYYEPSGKRHSLVHIIYSDSWCPDCQSEIAALAKVLSDPATDYRKKGVVYLEALGEGKGANVGATQYDLDVWLESHPSLLVEVLDPEAKSLGAFFDASSVPYNADIDARTMEILSTGTGYLDPAAVQVWIDWVSRTPAAKL